MILPKSIFSLVEHCGILITNTSVRLVELSGKQSVKAKGEVVSPVSLFNGDDVDQATLTQLLTELCKKINIKPRFAAIAIPEKIAYSREYTLPALSVGEISEALQWQIGTIFPFPPQDIYFDWRMIERNSTQTKVVVVAVTKKVIDSIISVFEAVGIHAISFEPSAAILSRAISKPDISDYIVLEIDGLGTSATLIKDRVASLTTTTHFKPDTNPQMVIDGIINSITTIIAHTYPDQKPTTFQLFVTGEKASENLVKLFTDRLQLTVSLLPISSIEPAYHVPFLSATSIILPPESEQSINLLPYSLQAEYRLEAERIQAKQSLLLGLIPVFVSLVAAIILTVMTTVQANLLKAKPQIANQTPPAVQVNVPLLLQKAQKITRIQPLNKVPTQIIDTLLKLQSDHIIIKHISVDMAKQTIQLTIAGESRAAFVEFKSNLETTNLVTNVTIPLAALTADSPQDALITMKMK